MIRLIPTTRDNWKEALELQVLDSQQHFVPPVVVSIAKVYIRPDGDEYKYLPFCIYNHEDNLVGFVMITVDDTSTWSYWLNGFMIDANYQGKGYGVATIDAVRQYIRVNYPKSECLNLTVNPDNVVARKLYEKMGFAESGDVYDHELVYRYVF